MAGDTSDYFDSEPVPFQEGPMSIVGSRGTAEEEVPTKLGLCRQGLGHKRKFDQEEARREAEELEKRAGISTFHGESSSTKLVVDLRQNVLARPMMEFDSKWDILVTEDSLAWLNSPDFLDMTSMIAKNLNK